MFGFPTAPPSLASPTIVGPAGLNFVCLTGVVNQFQFIRAPEPGSIIGTLTVGAGATLPLVQTGLFPASGVTLAAVNGQFATLCGNLTVAQGRVALDVRFVSPGFSPLTPGLAPFGQKGV